MNISYYISQRISKASTSGYSGTIIKIAIATIALSIAIMILSVSVLMGFKKGITEKVFGFWGHIHVTDSKISRTFELTPILNSDAIKDSISSIGYVEKRDEDYVQKIVKTQGGVTSINPYIMLPGIIKTQRKDLEGIILKGIDKDYKWQNFESYLKKGNFPKLGLDNKREILISQQTARRLKVDVGDKLNVYFVKDRDAKTKQFKISGIYRTGLEEYDVKFVFVDMSVLQDILEWDKTQIGGYEIFIDNIDDAELIADYVHDEILPANLYSETIKNKFGNLFKWIELQDMNALLLLILMTIVAIINMSTAILILILERSKMIGTLKALGMGNWDIRKIFIYNALWILAMAIIIGNVMGIGIALIQKSTGLLKLDETNYYLSEVPIDFDILAIVGINVITIIVTLLVMIIPSYMVTKISPIKILRFE